MTITNCAVAASVVGHCNYYFGCVASELSSGSAYEIQVNRETEVCACTTSSG
jgi:hypothetical protein